VLYSHVTAQVTTVHHLRAVRARHHVAYKITGQHLLSAFTGKMLF
jgi:hypothetical protein